MKPFIYSALVICAFASCKKPTDDKLIGTWKMTAMTIDENDNGKMDSGETVVPDSLPTYIYTFKGDGSADISYKGSYKGKVLNQLAESYWELSGNGSTLTIQESPTVPYGDAESMVYNITKFAKGEMQLKLESNLYHLRVWRTWTKQ